MENIILSLQQRKTLLNKYKQEALQRLNKLKYKGKPEYHIRFNTKRNQIYLNQKDDNKRISYIPAKKKSSVSQIATYDYLLEIIRLIDKEILTIDKSLKILNTKSPESYYSTLSKPRQNLIIPIVPTEEQFVENWLSEPYEPKPFDEDDESEFYTEKNERVRSKSEILIGNAMFRAQVPYKYECPLYLEGLGVIRPDFTALNKKRRKIFYWEHLGKMDDPEYARTNVSRINYYEKNGVLKGDRLILTWETSKTPLDVKLVNQMIKHYLLD